MPFVTEYKDQTLIKTQTFKMENNTQNTDLSRNDNNTMLGEVPVRIQRSRQHKQVSPNGLPIAYVGRGTRWGNPFRIVKYSDGKWAIKTDGSDMCNELLIKHCHAVYDTRDAAAIDAIKCYEFWRFPYTHKDGSIMDLYHSMANIDDAILSLKGKNLSCWCRLDEKCHADLLLELANR